MKDKFLSTVNERTQDLTVKLSHLTSRQFVKEPTRQIAIFQLERKF